MIPITCEDEQGACDSTSGAADGCKTVENASYKKATQVLKVPAPNLAECVCFVCYHVALSDSMLEPVVSPLGKTDRPLDWVTTWQFTRRQALPSRAPSFLCV